MQIYSKSIKNATSSSIQKPQQICTSGGDVYYASRNLLSTCLSWKGKPVLASSLSHKICPRKKHYWTRNWCSWYYFALEKLPHTLIPVIASTYCGKYAVPFLFWATLYIFVKGVIFIMLGITFLTKVCMSFHWYLIYFSCFTETCAERVNWGQCLNLNIAKCQNNFNQ